MAATDVDAVADELYALPPGEFVAARDSRAKQARAAGDKEAAGQIAALRKPTVVAWLANQLSRHRAEHVEPLVELGAAMREATQTLSGPQLRELSRQRNELVHALVQEARALGSGAGQRIGEETVRGLEATLHAALADAEAAQRLVEGRLSDGMTFSGFAPAGSASASEGTSAQRAGRRAPKRRPAEAEERAAQRAAVERELGAAWAEAGRAAEQRDAAIEVADRAERRKADATREVKRLRQELEGAETELTAAETAYDEAVGAREQADGAANKARQRVAELQARLDGL